MALLLQFYADLPRRRQGEASAQWNRRFALGLVRFEKAVRKRYTEGTLQRLLGMANAELRQAAVLALGLVGTMQVNEALTARLHDDDLAVRQMAGDALWSLWFRAEVPEHNDELQRLVRLSHNLVEGDIGKVLNGLDGLIQKAPRFAEAYNQRAILYFRLGEYGRAIADCERTLRLNPCHFGAASGMGQCLQKQKKFRAALRAFRKALRLNPNLDTVRQAIESLERKAEEGDL